MLEIKNFNAIDKIIAELSMRDYLAAANRLGKKRDKKTGMYKRVESYSLGADTLEALDVKYDYMNGRLTEEEYKAFCLRYNLLVKRIN